MLVAPSFPAPSAFSRSPACVFTSGLRCGVLLRLLFSLFDFDSGAWSLCHHVTAASVGGPRRRRVVNVGALSALPLGHGDGDTLSDDDSIDVDERTVVIAPTTYAQVGPTINATRAATPVNGDGHENDEAADRDDEVSDKYQQQPSPGAGAGGSTGAEALLQLAGDRSSLATLQKLDALIEQRRHRYTSRINPLTDEMISSTKIGGVLARVAALHDGDPWKNRKTWEDVVPLFSELRKALTDDGWRDVVPEYSIFLSRDQVVTLLEYFLFISALHPTQLRRVQEVLRWMFAERSMTRSKRSCVAEEKNFSSKSARGVGVHGKVLAAGVPCTASCDCGRSNNIATNSTEEINAATATSENMNAKKRSPGSAGRMSQTGATSSASAAVSALATPTATNGGNNSAGGAGANIISTPTASAATASTSHGLHAQGAGVNSSAGAGATKQHVCRCGTTHATTGTKPLSSSGGAEDDGDDPFESFVQDYARQRRGEVWRELSSSWADLDTRKNKCSVSGYTRDGKTALQRVDLILGDIASSFASVEDQKKWQQLLNQDREAALAGGQDLLHRATNGTTHHLQEGTTIDAAHHRSQVQPSALLAPSQHQLPGSARPPQPGTISTPSPAIPGAAPVYAATNGTATARATATSSPVINELPPAAPQRSQPKTIGKPLQNRTAAAHADLSSTTRGAGTSNAGFHWTFGWPFNHHTQTSLRSLPPPSHPDDVPPTGDFSTSFFQY
ncbi:unnamed protein product [Amoebophrya sp. A120]|nr:unnamed protein product [Amoebophrya sp. A120]|eukprot:GSA120T00006419001.1